MSDTTSSEPLTPELLAIIENAQEWVDLHPSFGWNVPEVSRFDGMGFAIAFQCATVIARDIAKAQMVLWKQSGRKWTEVLPAQHWFARMLRRKPNEFQSWTDFWTMLVMHLKLAQNAYILPVINRMGETTELLCIMPSRCRAVVSSAGKLFYEISISSEFERAQFKGRAETVVLPAERVIHLRGASLNGLNGISIAEQGNPLFSLASAINRYQTKLFSNDGRPSVVFETSQQFNGAEANVAFKRLRDQLADGVNLLATKGKPLLLDSGLTAKVISTNPRDAMTVEAFNQQVQRICGLMQVPPHKIFHYESVKYDNQSAANSQYANDCLIPIAKNIEEKVRLHLLTDEEIDDHWTEFDRMELQAGDPTTLINLVDKAMSKGLLTINEARDRLPLGLSPIEGGDVRLIPVNMAVFDDDGQLVHQAAAGQTQNLPASDEGGAAEDGAGDDASAKGQRLAVDNS